MKRVIAGLLLAGSVMADQGSSDFSVDILLTGVQIGQVTDDVMRLDLDVGARFISAHGAVVDTEGTSYPGAGSCFVTNSGGVFCNVQIDQFSYSLDLDQNMEGTVTVKDAAGSVLDTGTARIVNIL